MAKKKVAILGGGIGALTAAFQLTNTANWKDELESVTIYQIGWRLGGKCATSRNAAMRDRIEEHGIHYLLGFYENAFHVIRQIYDECRQHGIPAPFANWEDAFRQQSVITAMVDEAGWVSFGTIWPSNDDRPGDPRRFENKEHPPTGWELVKELYRRASQWAFSLGGDPQLGLDREQSRVLLEIGNWFEQAFRLANQSDPAPPVDSRDTRLILDLLARVERSLGDVTFAPLLAADVLPKPTVTAQARFLLIMLDIVRTLGEGILVDRLTGHDFSFVDDEEFHAWLVRHRCRHPDFAVIRSGYDACFAYRNGESTRPTMSAAVALNGGLRLWLTYRGSIFWPMRAGMAEVIFSPLYRLLEHRGVRFEFFHRVRELHLSSDRRRVETIDIDVQAELKDGVRKYEPLVKVGDIECWPGTPRYEQLKDPQPLMGRDMESAWNAPRPVGTRTLRSGTDFDVVVFGIALGAVPHLCKELLAQSADWRRMVERVPTVQTQALQLWMNITTTQCGYDHGTLVPTDEPACASAFVKPFDTFVDQSDLRHLEGWRPEDDVQQVSYFCSTFPDAARIPDPGSDEGFPDRELARVLACVRQFVEADLPVLFPNTTRGVGAFNWDLLVDITGGGGPKRLDAQFVRANIDPSARYVLSPPGAILARLQPDRSGFDNLFLAGDWTFTPMNSGCVEAATMSGLRAAQGVSGKPVHICGWR